MRRIRNISRVPLAGTVLAAGLLLFGLANPNEALAAPAWKSSSAIAASTGVDVTVTLPTHAADDILLLQVVVRDTDDTITWPAGWTQLATVDRGTTARYWWAWKRATSSAETNPLVDKNTTTGDTYAAVTVYSGALASSDPWDVIGTPNTSTAAAHVLNGVTTATADTLIIASVSGEDNSAASTTYSATDPTSLTQRLYVESVTGADGACAAGADAKTGTGATGNVTATWSATVVGSGGIVLALKPYITTTLGNGTDPANAALAPGGAATMADAFTFQTSAGTDTITDVTVGLGTGASAGLSLVEITDDAGTTVYGSTTDPASDTPTVTLSTNTLTATTTQTQYKIRITPKSHTAMPAPPGAAYTVTAKINSWTGTNTKLGSDTAGTTITIDNLSPGNVTAASGTAGDTQVALTWTNPADADLNSVVVLRDTAAVADTPVEGTTYTVGNTIGTSVVRCVVTPPTATCTDTSVTNGISYHYKIFTRDTNGNYATGVVPTGSPYTPAGPGCYSVATGNWGSSSTWASSAGGTPGTCPGSGGVPDSSTPVYINFTTTSHTVTVDVSNAAATSVRIGTPGTGTAGLAISSGTLNVSASVTLVGGTGTKKALLSFTTGTLKVGGTITESGATDVTFGTGTVEYNGTGAQTVTNYGYHNLTINKSSGTATTSGNITIGNNLTVNSGTLNIGANSINGSGGGSLRLESGGKLQIGGGTFPSNYATEYIDPNSTVEYNPGFNVNVPAKAYGHLLLSNSGNRNFVAGSSVAGNLTLTGTVVALMNGGITINGNLDIGSGTSFDAKLYSHTVNGNFANNGTFTPSTSTFTFNGTSAQGISGGATSFYNVVFNNAGGITTSVNLSVSGNFTNTAGFGAGSTTTTFNGTAAQTIGGASAPTFYNLTLNNAVGLTLNVNSTVSSTLTFSSGSITTGTYTLILSSATSCGVSGAGSGKYVIGKLRKSFNAATQTACDFEVGDSSATTHYTPLNVSFSGMAGSGTLTVAVKGGSGASATADDHPQVQDDSSGLDKTNSINRYWMLVPTGGFTFSNATLTFTHLNDATWLDHDNTANVGRYAVKRFALSDANCYTGEAGYTGSGSWSTTTATGTQTVTSTAATGITTFGANCSHFAIGRGAISSFLREKEFIFQREVNY